MKSPKILVVEDDSIIGLDIKNTLRDLGYDVSRVVTSGEKAVKEARELKPDIILMDIILSEKMDGVDAVKKIHEKHDIPVIYLTAHTEKITFKQARETNPYGYLIKPVGRNELYTAIETALHRHEMERKLKDSEERYAALFERSLDGVYLHDLEGNFIDANQTGLNMIGYSRSDINNLNFASLIPGEQLPMAINILKEIIETGTQKELTVFKIKRKDGEHIWVETKGSMIYKQGDPYAVQSMARDITGRNQAEESQRKALAEALQATHALQESEERFRSLSESSPMGVFHTDCEGFVLYTNNRWQEITGLTLEESLGSGWSKVLHPDDKKPILEEWGRCLREAKGYSGEFRFVSTSGDVKWVNTTTAPIRSETGRVIGHVGSNEDISERKQAEEQIKASLREKETLLKEIHHRVKNNMQVITSLLNLQENKIKDEELQDIFRSSKNRVRAMALVHETLYQSEDLASIDFGEYIKTIASELYHTFLFNPEKIELNIKTEKLQLDINKAIPCGLIINELVTNAIKHAFPPELKRKGKITISIKELKEKEDTIELAVKDNGAGIPESINIDNADSLGLTLVSSLAKDQLEGELEITRGKGTAFTIRFQLK